MNKIVKISLILLGVALLIGAGVYIKLFIIGNKSYEDIVINKVSVSESSIVIDGDITSSSRAYKDFSYTLVGTELYVTIDSVLVSKKYNTGKFEIKIEENGTQINNIHLTDNKSTKVIYSKN